MKIDKDKELVEIDGATLTFEYIRALNKAIFEKDKTGLIELGSFEDTADLPRYLTPFKPLGFNPSIKD